MENVELISS